MAEITGDSASNTGVGALLRASRVRIGEDLQDVALLLRIRYPYLEAIEGGRFEELPGKTYAVGFVRAYADHLGLDGEEVVRRFKAEAAGDEVSRTDLSFPTPIAEASVPGGAIVFMGLLIAILAYGAWYVSTSDENYLADLIEPIPERLVGLVSSDKSSKTLSPEPSAAADLPANTEPALVMPLAEMATSSRKGEMHADETAPTAIGGSPAVIKTTSTLASAKHTVLGRGAHLVDIRTVTRIFIHRVIHGASRHRGAGAKCANRDGPADGASRRHYRYIGRIAIRSGGY